jgi:hypothetical protein
VPTSQNHSPVEAVKGKPGPNPGVLGSSSGHTQEQSSEMLQMFHPPRTLGLETIPSHVAMVFGGRASER